MKIVFLPDHGDHPYQLLLKRALAGLGVEVFPGVGSSFLPAARSMLAHRPDIIHLHWSSPYLLGRNTAVSAIKSALFLLELAFCRACGARIAWSIHNLCNHEGYLLRLEMFFNRLIARLSGAIIVHCVSHKEAVREGYGLRDTSNIFVVEQGNYAAYYENAVTRAEARRRLGLGGEEKVFLFFGGIRRYKGVFELVKAFRGMDAQGLRLVIAGKPFDAGMRLELEEAVGGDPRIMVRPDFVPDAEVQVYMNACDAVVLPYLAITTSAALLLTMSFGKAVIAPALDYVSDIAGTSGSILYRPEDTEGLYSALQQALAADLAEMGRRNLALASGYSWDEAARKTVSVYSNLLK